MNSPVVSTEQALSDLQIPGSFARQEKFPFTFFFLSLKVGDNRGHDHAIPSTLESQRRDPILPTDTDTQCRHLDRGVSIGFGSPMEF